MNERKTDEKNRNGILENNMLNPTLTCEKRCRVWRVLVVFVPAAAQTSPRTHERTDRQTALPLWNGSNSRQTHMRCARQNGPQTSIYMGVRGSRLPQHRSDEKKTKPSKIAIAGEMGESHRQQRNTLCRASSVVGMWPRSNAREILKIKVINF